MHAIETILTRMMNEPDFAEKVYADAEKALAEYNLPPGELARLKNISTLDVDAMQELAPEKRKSLAAFVKRVTIKLYVEEMD